MPRIIVLDELAEEGLTLLRAAENVDFEIRTGLKDQPLRAALLDFDGALCRSGVKLTAKVLEGNTRLKAIVRAGVGTDNIDLQAATRQGIVVMNTPAGNTLSTAEHTLAMLLALARNIAPAYQSLCQGKWDRALFTGTQLAGKTLGVIGLGRIGQVVAERARAFEMRVLGYDPLVTSQRAAELGIELCGTIHQMLPQVDFLTVHTPLTAETRNLIGYPELALLRPGVRLINCARGGLYDEAALLTGLQSGQIGGVALDVFTTEPCTTSPLFGLPGVVATPHLGASTEEAQTQVALEGVRLLLDFFTTGAIRQAVNIVPIDPQLLANLRGYLMVAYRLGLLLAELHRGGVQTCQMTYRGELATKQTKLITASFAAGFLQKALEQDVNLINAELLLRERGIELVEQSRRDTSAFSSVMTAELTTEHGSLRVSGTLLGREMARLVELQNFRLEAYLDGCLLIFQHQDVPGLIGKVGTIFGNYQVNIGQMAVGRREAGGEAIGVLNLDCEPPVAAIDAVLALPEIESAAVVHLPPAGELPSWLQE